MRLAFLVVAPPHRGESSSSSSDLTCESAPAQSGAAPANTGSEIDWVWSSRRTRTCSRYPSYLFSSRRCYSSPAFASSSDSLKSMRKWRHMTYDHTNNACLQRDGLFIDVLRSLKTWTFEVHTSSITTIVFNRGDRNMWRMFPAPVQWWICGICFFQPINCIWDIMSPAGQVQVCLFVLWTINQIKCICLCRSDAAIPFETQTPPHPRTQISKYCM